MPVGICGLFHGRAGLGYPARGELELVKQMRQVQGFQAQGPAGAEKLDGGSSRRRRVIPGAQAGL